MKFFLHPNFNVHLVKLSINTEHGLLMQKWHELDELESAKLEENTFFSQSNISSYWQWQIYGAADGILT